MAGNLQDYVLVDYEGTPKVGVITSYSIHYTKLYEVYVSNASRAVGVAQSLLSTELKPAFAERLSREYETVREQHARKQPRTKAVSLAEARANAWSCDWATYQPPKPAQPGIHVLRKVAIATLRNYIDWTPFFLSWELAGKFPRILEDEVVGEEAKRLYADANAMLDRLEGSGEVAVTGMLGLRITSYNVCYTKLLRRLS